MSIMGFSSTYGKYRYEKTAASLAKPAEEKPAEEKPAEQGSAPKADYVEISKEGRLAAESGGESLFLSDAEEKDEEETSEGNSGRVAVNVLKRARQIAAAKSRGQLQQVLALLEGDMSDCKAGLESGMCDESEIAKVEALINQAKARMAQVSQESDEDAGIDAFDLAALM